MWKWVLGRLVEWAVNNLTEEMMKEWIDKAKQVIVPWVRGKKDQLVAELKTKAAATDNTLDDVAVEALDTFLTALLPDNTETL